ncbi:MAG: putative site-specific DNA-methyltransferase [Gaeavirus sp.]|uniref:Putative site-specific DNA-methyltransferase n=1 Tax=Gaeavirus sp. TaxID=2487767 RepID=A0A3G5A154_9VIRU|nr:MAG: putative site-specific DNA-methyltransferase [Gaeavirus sp.]
MHKLFEHNYNLQKIDFYISDTQIHYKMAFTNTTITEFIEYILQFDTVDEILNERETQADKDIVYEKLWDICIKFGFCSTFPNSQYIHKIGNLNTAELKTLSNLNKYVSDTKVYNDDIDICSTIILQNSSTNAYIFITSKYDIKNIIDITTKHIYTDYQIYILVPDKNKVEVVADNKYITKNNILDEYDLNKCFLLFKKSINQNKEFYETLNYNELYMNFKNNLTLRFHQEMITSKTADLILSKHKSFLWGCKCRSGKTYMIGGLLLKLLNIKKTLNALIIIPAPTETAPQFTEDLFNNFRDFSQFKIHHIQNSSSIKSITLSKNNIFIASKQLLQKYIDNKTILKIKNLKLDVIGFDENHHSGTTDLSKAIIDSYSSKNTAKIFLTATYSKPLREWNIATDCQMYWGTEDEQICKSIVADNHNISKLADAHGKSYVNNTVKHFINLGYNVNDIFSSYLRMPDMHLITNLFDTTKYDDIIKKLETDAKTGFCFDTLLGLNNLKTQFSFKTEVKTFLRYISGSNKEDGDKTIFKRINNICSKYESRKPFTQIWFLPTNYINEISECLKILMLEDNVLNKYEILCVNRKNKDLAKDVKEDIIMKETEAMKSEKHGLILLAGSMLTLGITLNKCDAVILMNDSVSTDKVFQQIYRCMTEGTNKKIGFVIDLNINRVLNICLHHTIHTNCVNIADKLTYLIENHLIHIDADMMDNKKIDSNTVLKKLMDTWKNDPVNNFKSLLKNLDYDADDIDSPTQKIINNIFTKSNSDVRTDITFRLKDHEDQLQVLPTGKETHIDKTDKVDDFSSESESDDEELNISFTKDILPYIIPLAAILTMKTPTLDLIKILNEIKVNKELLYIFDDQCTIWWNKNNLIDIIINIVSKHYDKSSNVYNITVQFKMSIQGLIDKPKELLELIADCLKPKDIEKKLFGEVFTPMNFINDNMLHDLEEYWTIKHKENIWTNDTITFYDPASGMGNYPIAIYYKLFEGLKSKIPNDNKRIKHILEKQIYIGELNKKNCSIIKQIFNINDEHKLNLYEGDTLTIDITKVFNISKFDIIIGNPPYNEILTKVGAKPLYNKFIEYYMNKCSILTFITPSRWFAGGKGLDKFRKMMLDRTDIVFIKHFDNASKIFGNSISIEGGVNYFIIDHQYNDLCSFNNSKINLGKYDVLIDNKYYNIIDKLSKYDSLTTLYLGRYFGIESNDERLSDDATLIKCYVSQQKGFIKYITDVKKDYKFYKVITARANGQNKCFGNIFIGDINEVHTGSYISFKIDTKEQAESLLSYMKCKLPNFMLSLRKISQDINESTCKWIPLPSLNKIWNDIDVYKYFKLTTDEINMIDNA